MYEIDGVRNLAETHPFDQIKAAIVGPPKTGKSWLAATAPQYRYDKDGNKIPGYEGTYFADFDDRLISVAGKRGVFGKTYLDSNPMAPTAFPNFIQDLGLFEYLHSQGKVIPATIVPDSMTYLSQAALRYVMSQSSTGTKLLDIGGFKLRIARGYEPYDGETSYITSSLQRIVAMGCNLIVCFHDRPEEAPDSTQEIPKYTGKVVVEPPRAKKLLALFNELWLMSNDGSGYKVQTKPDYKFTAATTLNIDEIENPSIVEMIEKHKTRSK